jgi:hypothetical protein
MCALAALVMATLLNSETTALIFSMASLICIRASAGLSNPESTFAVVIGVVFGQVIVPCPQDSRDYYW